MTQFVQKSGMDFFAELFLAGFGLVPDIVEKQDNLWRQGQRSVFFIGELRADEQPEGVGLDGIPQLGAIGTALAGDWQRLGPLLQRRGQRGEDCGNLGDRQSV